MLLEEELVVLDMQTPGWPAVPAPYLAPLHSSAITCSAHVANVPAKLWARIVSAGEQQSPQPASGASVCAGGEGGAGVPRGCTTGWARGGDVAGVGGTPAGPLRPARGAWHDFSLHPTPSPRAGPSLGAGTWLRSHPSEACC